MRPFFAYTRVSTAKQGERGVSLQEQRDAIEAHARRHGLVIAQWFEERETAAKRGRAVFTQMLRLLQKREADGVIIHKIDRSARNLRDWAELGELIDRGITVHFANENLDLYTRGGRLSADIQAVVAADYIRNLREEVKKGFYGRLKQGLYPLPAPLGYLNRGKGKTKEIDPDKAPIIRKVFELYGTGRFSLKELVKEAHALGLRSRGGRKVHKTSMAYVLSNPFYMGIIRIGRTGETFRGQHDPIIPKSLFDRVQAVRQGKTVMGAFRHDYTFRRLLTCKQCAYSLIGERQKGNVYYRCHTANCPTTTIREDAVDYALIREIKKLRLPVEDDPLLQRDLAASRQNRERDWDAFRSRLKLELGKRHERLVRLTDAFLDGAIDREMYDLRKAALLMEQKALEEKLSKIEREEDEAIKRVERNLELAKTAYCQYNLGILDKKREVVTELTSNRLIDGKTLEIKWYLPFQIIAEYAISSNGAPFRDRPRTFAKLIEELLQAARNS